VPNLLQKKFKDRIPLGLPEHIETKLQTASLRNDRLDTTTFGMP